MDYRVNIHSLTCHVPDESDLDEIYLVWDGNQIWPKNERFERAKIGVTKLDIELGPQPPDEVIRVELWDHDSLSLNDHLGDFILQPDKLGSFSSELTSPISGKVKYTLEWEVD